jgi:hypothetical protein
MTKEYIHFVTSYKGNQIESFLDWVREGINLAINTAINHHKISDEDLLVVRELKENIELYLNTIDACNKGMKVARDENGNEYGREESLNLIYSTTMAELTHLLVRFSMPVEGRSIEITEALKRFTSPAREARKQREACRQNIIKDKYKGKLSISDTCSKRIIERLKPDFEAAGVDFSISTIKRDIRNILANRTTLSE